MELTLTASWNYVDTNTKHVAGYTGYRLGIAGYIAVVEEKEFEGEPVFEFTVLHDLYTIVDQGLRGTLGVAKNAAEMAIEKHVKTV